MPRSSLVAVSAPPITSGGGNAVQLISILSTPPDIGVPPVQAQKPTNSGQEAVLQLLQRQNNVANAKLSAVHTKSYTSGGTHDRSHVTLRSMTKLNSVGVCVINCP
jgi:phosphoribosylcarboxyaminoimidazole (NCAIR) mutase